MRGSVLSPDDYQRCTHICVKPALQIEGKKFVIESWINKYCAENAIIYDKSDLEKNHSYGCAQQHATKISCKMPIF